jgi:hypothetical protein
MVAAKTDLPDLAERLVGMGVPADTLDGLNRTALDYLQGSRKPDLNAIFRKLSGTSE